MQASALAQPPSALMRGATATCRRRTMLDACKMWENCPGIRAKFSSARAAAYGDAGLRLLASADAPVPQNEGCTGPDLSVDIVGMCADCSSNELTVRK